jgi:hypothetical protein
MQPSQSIDDYPPLGFLITSYPLQKGMHLPFDY